MKIKEIVGSYLEKGFSLEQSEHNAVQEILLSLIDKSPFKEKITFKGGLVLFHLSNNVRRTTSDIDFDFIKFDISSNDNIDSFVGKLNEVDPNINVQRIGEITTLHHQDYKGKRISLLVNDETYELITKIDIGVHTLLNFKQKKLLLSIDNGNNSISIIVNPPEQIVTEKLMSLYKVGIKTTRYKDILDIYYLITNYELNRKKILNGLNIISGGDTKRLIESVSFILTNPLFLKRLKRSNSNWLNVDLETATRELIIFLKELQKATN